MRYDVSPGDVHAVAVAKQEVVGNDEAVPFLGQRLLAGRTYRLVHHNLTKIQDIREEASLIFWMEDGEGLFRRRVGGVAGFAFIHQPPHCGYHLTSSRFFVG